MTLARTQFKRQPAKEPKPKPGPRQRKCKCCGASFVPQGLASWCSLPCAHKLAMALLAKKKAKDARQERAVTKAKLKTRADWLREAQAAINSWVRLVRDADKPCISCGRQHEGKYDCGHYLSRGAHPNLAFVENNLAKQCVPCNQYLSGNQIRFRQGLIARIGLEAVETLESDNEPRKYSISDLQAIKADYSQRLRELKGKLWNIQS